LQKKVRNIIHFYIIDQIGITGKGTEYVLRGHEGANDSYNRRHAKGYNWANAATRRTNGAKKAIVSNDSSVNGVKGA